MFEQILLTIKQYSTIIIHRHKNPDGDALGCQVGLKHIILQNFPDKKVYTVGDATPRYSFIEDSATDTIDDATYSGALAIILDTASRALISDERYTLAEKTIRMDHHLFCEKIADIEVVETSHESCCGLVTSFAMECGLSVPAIAAKALYTGMITDSGRFRYDSTSAKTFRNAAFLMEQNFETADIFRNLYADDLSFIQLRAKFVLKINMTDRRVAYIYTTLEEAKSYCTDSFTLSRGMVNVMSEIRGIDIWVNFTETEDGVLCELRSNSHNINPIAKKYGGGGHEKASGATVSCREEAMNMLEDLMQLTEVTK